MSEEKEEQSGNKASGKEEEEKSDSQRKKENERKEEIAHKRRERTERTETTVVTCEEDNEKEKRRNERHKLKTLNKYLPFPRKKGSKKKAGKDFLREQNGKYDRCDGTASGYGSKPEKQNRKNVARTSSQGKDEAPRPRKKDNYGDSKFIDDLFSTKRNLDKERSTSTVPRRKLKEGDDSIIASKARTAQPENYELADLGIGQSPSFPKSLVPASNNENNGKLFVDGVPFWKCYDGEAIPEITTRDLFSRRLCGFAQSKLNLQPPPDPPDLDADYELKHLMSRDEKYFERDQVTDATAYSLVEFINVKKKADTEKPPYQEPKITFKHPEKRISYSRFDCRTAEQPFKKSVEGSPMPHLRKQFHAASPSSSSNSSKEGMVSKPITPRNQSSNSSKPKIAPASGRKSHREELIPPNAGRKSQREDLALNATNAGRKSQREDLALIPPTAGRKSQREDLALNTPIAGRKSQREDPPRSN